jgi:hypothetical protein
MSTSPEYDRLVASLNDLSIHFDMVTEKLRIYDTARRMMESDYKPQAAILKFCMEQAERLPELRNSASPEYKAMIQNLRELAAHVFQASSNPPTP